MAKFKDINIEPVCEVYPNGDKYWRLNGKRHRLGGPAVESLDSAKFWYKHGKRHREDGPACEWADGRKSWYLNGKYLFIKEAISNSYLRRKYPKLIEAMVIHSVHDS
jgi:hypothetical protein